MTIRFDKFLKQIRVILRFNLNLGNSGQCLLYLSHDPRILDILDDAVGCDQPLGHNIDIFIVCMPQVVAEYSNVAVVLNVFAVIAWQSYRLHQLRGFKRIVEVLIIVEP